MNKPVRLALFAKSPVPGFAKTRLGKDIGAAAAAAFSEATTLDLVEELVQLSWAELWFAERAPQLGMKLHYPPLLPAVRIEDVSRFSNLTDKLEYLLVEDAERYVGTAVIPGDLLSPPRAFLEPLPSLLEKHDLVLGAVPDGSMWLISVASRCLPRLRKTNWLRCHTAPMLSACALQAGLSVGSLAEWFDLDERADLEVLKRALAERTIASPRVAAWLAQNH